MYHYILCYGRTKFTEYTIKSIIENAKYKPKIVLLNNGWNANTVPVEVVSLWDSFIYKQLYEGNIAKIINLPTSPTFALDGLQVADHDCPEEFYFITDNDCIIQTSNFDEMLHNGASKHGLNKLGADFYRSISLDYCKQFHLIAADLNHYYPCPTDNLHLRPTGPGYTYCQLLNIPETELFPESGITNNVTDTTLSIVRKGHSVSQHSQNRLSPSLKGIDMLHAGYLEPIFKSKNSLETIEMLVYAKNRLKNLPDQNSDYQKRFDSYKNLVNQKDQAIYNFSNHIITI